MESVSGGKPSLSSIAFVTQLNWGLNQGFLTPNFTLFPVPEASASWLICPSISHSCLSLSPSSKNLREAGVCKSAWSCLLALSSQPPPPLPTEGWPPCAPCPCTSTGPLGAGRFSSFSIVCVHSRAIREPWRERAEKIRGREAVVKGVHGDNAVSA